MHVILITGAGEKAFVAGGDISTFADAGFPAGVFRTLMIESSRVAAVIGDPRVHAVQVRLDKGDAGGGIEDVADALLAHGFSTSSSPRLRNADRFHVRLRSAATSRATIRSRDRSSLSTS